MPRDRYLVAPSRTESLGGFYGRPVGGYYYFNDLGFGTTLNEDSAPNKTLRTLDLVRSYLHDSLHASTFRTFRIDKKTGIIFRHQYGINFRNANRISYSAPNANENSPNTVNLNTWMDALVHMQASNFINQHCGHLIDTENLTPFEREIWSEVKDMRFDGRVYKEPLSFYEKVIAPAKNFMDKWGNEFLFDETLKSMLTGKMDNLKDYFGQIFMKEGAWSDMFKQDAYEDIDNMPAQRQERQNKTKNWFKKRK